MEVKILEAIKKDAADILLSLLPDNQILNYIFTNNIQTNESILRNCPPLHCVAAYFGSIKCLQLLFDQGNRFKTEDKNLKNIIDFSLEGGHQEVFKFLIDHGYSIEYLIKSGISRDNVSIIHYAIANTNNININSLIFQSIEAGSLEIIKYLSLIVEDINIFDENGNTLLHIATEHSKHDILKLLLTIENSKTKIDTNPTNPQTNQSLLHIAAKQQDNKMLSLILSSHNCNESNNETGWDFMTLDFLAPENDVRRKKNEKMKNPPKILDFNQKDKNGDTPLIIASREGCLDNVQAFLSLNSKIPIDLNATNKELDNALIVAVKKGRFDVVEKLIEREELQLNHLNKSGLSALHIACQNEDVQIVSLLLKLDGIDANVKSGDNGSTPLHISVLTKIVNSEVKSEAIFNELLNCPKIDTKIKNDENMTPFFLATKEGNKNFFLKLLKMPGASFKDVGINGQTPLHSAARFNHFEICKLIVETSLDNEANDNDYAIDINQKDNDGWTPLHYAARNGYKEIVEFMLSVKGIDINARDNRDKTPLYFAMNQDVREILEEHGAVQ